MFYNDFGDFLNNPPLLVLTLFSRNRVFLVFWTFRELRDSKKGKVKEHGSEFSRKTSWAKIEDQEPNQQGDGGSAAASIQGRVGPPRFTLVAPMPSVFVSVASS